MVVPGAAVRQHRRGVLAEQAGHMPALGGEAAVQDRGDQHLDDGRPGPSGRPGVREGPLHIAQRGGHDDTGGEVVASLGQAGEARQFRQGHVHAEGG